MKRIAIVGSRPFPDPQFNTRICLQVYAYVSNLPKDTVIVSGGAGGVDSYAAKAAKYYGLPEPIVHLPKWKNRDGSFNKAAGFERNALIVRDADEVVAFWDGKSKGTANTIRVAQHADKPVSIFPITEVQS